MSARRAADIIWTMTDARLYQSMVLMRHWSEPAFEQWLYETLRMSLLCSDVPGTGGE
jgi:hypothetical protein